MKIPKPNSHFFAYRRGAKAGIGALAREIHMFWEIFLQSRNPHHDLQEKLKTLTLLYEQQKQASLKLQEEKFVMRENSMPIPNATLTTTFVLPHPPHAKENAIVDTANRILAFSCPRKTGLLLPNANISCSVSVARKLSIAIEAGPLEGKFESRILVFVRLRPMNRKEKEAGSR
ncbi:hypothetical protein Fmac_021859 [Flemingia macrophylla]|uniref:Kinesin motor domain-containing protein n=1 Tax=Flemingia macrophylla TaxID=520843 RepID=A0ABD1LY24_9FABA